MDNDPSDFLAYRGILDVILALILVAVILLYLWAAMVGPVSAADPTPARPVPASATPFPEPVSPAGKGGALV